MQAYPNLSHAQIRQAIVVSGDRYSTPDSLYGHGIPDYTRAKNIAITLGTEDAQESQKGRLVFPNPFENQLCLKIANGDTGHFVHWKVTTASGVLVKEDNQLAIGEVLILLKDGKELPSGVYIVTVSGLNDFSTFKLIK